MSVLSVEKGAAGARPVAPAEKRLVIVAAAPSPYRIHQHRRFAAELSGLRLTSVFLREHNRVPWRNDLPPEIGPVVLGPGESTRDRPTPARALQLWKRGGEVIRLLNDQQADAVIVTGYNDPCLLRVILWCRRRGVPCFMFSDSNIRSDRASGAARLFKNLYVPFVLRSLTGLLPCGTRGAEYFEKYGGRRERMFFVPHEPDYDRIAAISAADVEAARRKHGLRTDRRYFNYCARLSPVKRPDLLLRAFARIADERPGWDLLMVGGGELESELKASVPDRLRDRILWTGFLADPAEVAALYKASDVHVLPSSYEPWAVVIPEAAACGVAIVASDVVGAAADLVVDGENGMQFHSGDEDDLTRCLLHVSDAGNIERLKAGSARVLADWRRRGDPVDGVRRALVFAGVLPEPQP